MITIGKTFSKNYVYIGLNYKIVYMAEILSLLENNRIRDLKKVYDKG